MVSNETIIGLGPATFIGGPVPLSVAEYLRHLSVRCACMARDCHDPAIAKKLEIISFELVEKAQHLERQFNMPNSSDDENDPDRIGITSAEDDSAG